MQNFAAISFVTHILLILVAITLVILVSLEKTEIPTQVMSWALFTLLLIHFGAIYAEHKWGAMSMIALVLVLLALGNAIIHHIDAYSTRSTSAITGLVAGAVIVSFFVFHRTIPTMPNLPALPALPTFRRPNFSRLRGLFRRSAPVEVSAFDEPVTVPPAADQPPSPLSGPPSQVIPNPSLSTQSQTPCSCET